MPLPSSPTGHLPVLQSREISGLKVGRNYLTVGRITTLRNKQQPVVHLFSAKTLMHLLPVSTPPPCLCQPSTCPEASVGKHREIMKIKWNCL